MFEIDRLQVEIEIENNMIVEKNYYAFIGNVGLKLGKGFVLERGNEKLDPDAINVFMSHLVEARSIAMKKHLIKIVNNNDSENIKISMMKLDRLAYYKAQKLFWEDKINIELVKKEQEELD